MSVALTWYASKECLETYETYETLDKNSLQSVDPGMVGYYDIERC